MASAEIVMPAMGILAVLYGGPPVLVVLSCIRRWIRARELRRNVRPYMLGVAGGTACLLFNMAVVLPTLSALTGGTLRFTGLSLVGLILSWLCFWTWVALGTLLRQSRRPAL